MLSQNLTNFIILYFQFECKEASKKTSTPQLYPSGSSSGGTILSRLQQQMRPLPGPFGAQGILWINPVFFQLKFNVIFCNKVYQDRDIFPRLIIWDIHRLTWVFIIWGRILQELLHHLLLAVLSIMDWEREHREFMCLLSSVECPDLMEYLGNVKKKGIFVGKWELNKIIGIYICRGSGPMYPPGHGYQGQQSLLHHQLQSLDPSLGIRPPHSQEYQSRYSISG